MRIVVHVIAPLPDEAARSAVVASLSAVQPAGAAGMQDDRPSVCWSVTVPRDEHGWELEVNRLLAELGEALQPVAAGHGIRLEIEIRRADRVPMNTHVGLAFPPELLARLGAWGIELVVASDLH